MVSVQEMCSWVRRASACELCQVRCCFEEPYERCPNPRCVLRRGPSGQSFVCSKHWSFEYECCSLCATWLDSSQVDPVDATASRRPLGELCAHAASGREAKLNTDGGDHSEMAKIAQSSPQEQPQEPPHVSGIMTKSKDKEEQDAAQSKDCEAVAGDELSR